MEKKNASMAVMKSWRVVRSGTTSLSSVITPKPPTRMCVGIVRTDRIISGDITAISYPKQGKS